LTGETVLPSQAGFHELAYKSPVTAGKVRIMDRAAKTDCPVLLQGESGTGKEVFAEQIHLRSLRSGRPFVRVNCAAIPPGLLESELFGHVKGAFTGAAADRKGRFEAAEGGTLFLDEIGDFPPAVQAKLLRVLQEKTFEKVGSDITVRADVRLLAATNRDIEAMAGKGEFRSDLYYRLNVLPLFIPPLRQRVEDIPFLAGFFLARFMQKPGARRFGGFSQDASRAMLSHRWPGNIRELENAVERACVTANGDLIEPEDLMLESGLREETPQRDLKSALNVFRAGFIRNVLEENGGNRTEAAKAMGIQRTYLSRLIKDLGIK